MLSWCAVQERICKKAICIRARTRTPAAQISKYKDDAVQQGVKLGFTLKHGRFWKNIPSLVSLSFKWSSPSEIGRAGSRACAAARPRGQVWRPWQRGGRGVRWRAKMQYMYRKTQRAWGARPGRAHLPLATGPRKRGRSRYIYMSTCCVTLREISLACPRKLFGLPEKTLWLGRENSLACQFAVRLQFDLPTQRLRKPYVRLLFLSSHRIRCRVSSA